MNMKDKCKRYKENAIPCIECPFPDEILNCYQKKEEDFNCTHFDGKDCRGPELRKTCPEDNECPDYEELEEGA